jgi:L-fuconolactonase
MAKRFPSVRIIMDHCARPTLSDGPPYRAAAALMSLAPCPNVYLKLTPRVFEEAAAGKATPETFFPLLVSEFGAGRLAWGSNYPASPGTLAGLLALARHSLGSLRQDDQAWIFARTAQTLYPALAD